MTIELLQDRVELGNAGPRVYLVECFPRGSDRQWGDVDLLAGRGDDGDAGGNYKRERLDSTQLLDGRVEC